MEEVVCVYGFVTLCLLLGLDVASGRCFVSWSAGYPFLTGCKNICRTCHRGSVFQSQLGLRVLAAILTFIRVWYYTTYSYEGSGALEQN